MAAQGAGSGRDAALVLGALGAGAALMYALDPVAGRRRRALARDRVVHLGRVGEESLAAATEDLRNRAQGLVAGARARFRRAEAVTDDVLVARVRELLGHWVSHPGAIEVQATDGCVTLAGPVLTREARRLLPRVARVAGVRGVDDRLERHDTPADVPALQGGRPRAGTRPEFLQESWSPGARLLGGAAGAALLGWAMRHRDGAGLLLGLAGALTLARSAANVPLRRLGDVAAGRRSISLQKTVTIDVPVARVFDFWRRPENFPTFMRHVRAVRAVDETRSHWVVEGPAGTTVEWDAETTQIQPNVVVAWRTLPGASVEHAGMVHFEPVGETGTRVHVRMSYHPPAGAAGHVVATLLGANPKQQLDDDLERMKTALERGVPPRDAAQPAPEGGMR